MLGLSNQQFAAALAVGFGRFILVLDSYLVGKSIYKLLACVGEHSDVSLFHRCYFTLATRILYSIT